MTGRWTSSETGFSDAPAAGQGRARWPRAAELFNAAADPEAALREALRCAVPGFADWCMVDYYAGDHELRTVHSGNADAREEALILQIRRRYRLEQGEDGDVPSSARPGGMPLLCSDMSEIAPDRLSAAEGQPLTERDLRSSVVVPMHSGGEPLGVVSFVSMSRRYEEEDLAAAQEFAAACVPVLSAIRELDEIQHSLALLDTLWGSAPIALGFVDRELRLRRLNRRLAAFAAAGIDETEGARTLAGLLGGLGEQLEELCRRVLHDGAPVIDVELAAATPASPDVAAHWLVSCTAAVRGPRVVGVSCVVQDITARKQAEMRADFLAHAGEVLDSSLDYRQTLRQVVRLAVPDIADWCSVSMLDEAGRMYRLAVAHADAEKNRVAQELIEREALPPDGSAGAAAVVHAGAGAQSIEQFEDRLIAESIDDERSREIIRGLGIGSSLTVPLAARGRTVGALSLVRARSFGFTEDDTRLAEELASRAGVAIDNARLYTEHTRIARTLQASLAPPPLPDIPGLQLAARYRPAGEYNEVGGDFYDIYLRSAGQWLVVIGDVTGKGAKAAATTGLIRYTLRAAALRGGSSTDLLRELNRAMLAQDASFCTIVLLAIDTRSSAIEMSICQAGHPPPFLLAADGTLTAVPGHGTMLGYAEDIDLTESRLEIRPDDVLLLYTDGLTDAASPGWSDAQLHAEIRASADRDLDRLLAGLESRVVAAAGGSPRDDIALLALRATTLARP